MRGSICHNYGIILFVSYLRYPFPFSPITGCCEILQQHPYSRVQQSVNLFLSFAPVNITYFNNLVVSALKIKTMNNAHTHTH
jgi:hypothetical protein